MVYWLQNILTQPNEINLLYILSLIRISSQVQQSHLVGVDVQSRQESYSSFKESV